MSKPSQLYQVTAKLRGEILEDLTAKKEPRIGQFEPEILKDAWSKGAPQLGSQRFAPNGYFFEFLFPDPQGSTLILTVFVESPERIVFLPVPSWVKENIWQGDIEGTFVFESEVAAILKSFENLLTPENNASLFVKDSEFVKW